MPRKKTDRVVVITGVSHGVGKTMALEFALHASTTGTALVLSSRREASLDTVRRDCEALHALTESHVADLADPDAGYALANAALARFRRIDLWINFIPLLPAARGDVTPAGAFSGMAALDFAAYDNGANAAFATFRALGGGVLINVDPLTGGAVPGCESEFLSARRRVRATFAGIEHRAKQDTAVHVCSVSPVRSPIASDVLARSVVRAAKAQLDPGLVGRARGILARERLRLWGAFASTAASGDARARGAREGSWRLSNS